MAVGIRTVAAEQDRTAVEVLDRGIAGIEEVWDCSELVGEGSSASLAVAGRTWTDLREARSGVLGRTSVVVMSLLVQPH